jgi:Tol biopolymer transport system component/tRNA A-37 threonylcarbamoyl transferase component Bud32
MALAPNTKLGPYEIQSPLGAGGMGEVYRARDTRLDRTVAIKVLPPHLSSNLDLKQRFEREARAISSLNHPRICTLHDVGHQDGVDFLVMEYLEGESLADRMKKGPLALKESLRIGIEVCQALEAAQRSGIVHRDLKPGNIMLTKNGAKLMDFGLAKVALSGLASASSAPLLSAAKTMSEATPLSPLTSAGMVIGTIQYMSPEQIEGKEADARSDLFALGAVLYEMATGKRPFDGKSQLSLASSILERDPAPIRTIKPLTPAAFERVVSSCLAKNPDDRFQTAHDVGLELDWIAVDLPQLGAPSAEQTAKVSAKALPWIVTAVVLAGGAALLLRQREGPIPRYTNVSFREGMLLGARFSHDGQTIVYSGKWEGAPSQISVARIGSPESRPLGIRSAEVASVSPSDQLAVFLGCDEIYFLTCGGTLAAVDLAGGSPRTLAEHVAQADWHPDGKRMVISVLTPEGARLEFPPGHVLFQQSGGWIGHPRFSPDGSSIAFENHPILGNDDGSIDLIDMNGSHTVLSTNASVEGLAWRPDGKEVWFAGTKTSGWADTIFAVTPAGKERAILSLPSLRLHDISKDGRVLLSRETWRRQIRGLFPGDTSEHPYSWLDDTEVTAISADGRFISIYEAGEIYYLENNSLAYYRGTDGSPAVRLGVGTAAISPDGRWVLIASNHMNPKLPLQLQPIGPGGARDLPTPGLIAFDHLVWSDDGRQVVYEGETDERKWNIYKQAAAGGEPLLVRRDSRDTDPVISPSGDTVALREGRGGISLYRGNESQPVPVKAAWENEYPIRFVKSGKALLVAEQTGDALALTVIDLASGHRETWKRIPDDYSSRANQLFVATPDLKYYAYPFPRYSSVLYTVENLH